MAIEFVVVLICLIFNAILSCVEMAFVSVGRPLLRQMASAGNTDARRLLALRENPERTLSVLQIGITLVGVISAAVGGAGAEEILSPLLQTRFELGEGPAEALAILIVVVPITVLSVVLGELVPKTVALKRPLSIALFSSRWLALADAVLAPLVGVMEWTTKQILRIFFRRLRPERHSDSESSVELGNLSDVHRQYVINLVQLEKKQMRDVMLPWDKVVTMGAAQSLAEAASALLASGHSRIPVIDQGEVKGFLYSKEFMIFSATGNDNWTSILRPILSVRDTDSLLRVMRTMQEKRNHLSLVYSAENKLLGIVTLEDILEEVVGEIYDEDDDGRLKALLASSGKLRFSQTRKAEDPVLFQSPLPSK